MKNKESDYWQKFLTTGNINDYLLHKIKLKNINVEISELESDRSTNGKNQKKLWINNK